MSEYASQSAATSTRPAITCVGSMMIDLIFYSADVPGEGETVFGDDFAQGFGGKGANQCVVASLLGADVAMIGALGDDGFGRETVQNFESFGIDASQVLLLESSGSNGADESAMRFARSLRWVPSREPRSGTMSIEWKEEEP